MADDRTIHERIDAVESKLEEVLDHLFGDHEEAAPVSENTDQNVGGQNEA